MYYDLYLDSCLWINHDRHQQHRQGGELVVLVVCELGHISGLLKVSEQSSKRSLGIRHTAPGWTF